MSKEQIAKIIATEDLIEKANLIIEMFRQKPSGFLSLSEVYGIKPLNRTEMDLVVDLLLKEGCEFTEKNAGIDLKKLAYAPTIIKVPDSKEPETIEEFFEEKKVEVEPLDIHPSFHDPSEAMVFDINEKVNGIAFYLTNKPCYQLSALTGDIEHHPEGWIKSPAHYWLIEKLKEEGFRVESSDLRNRPNYKFYTIYGKEPKTTKPVESASPKKTEDQIIEEKAKKRLLDTPKPEGLAMSNGDKAIVIKEEEMPLVVTASLSSETETRLSEIVRTDKTDKKTKKEKVEEVAVKEFEEDPNYAKELHEELQDIHKLIQKPWSGQHEELKSHIAILSVKYARLTEIKIDAETACIRKNAAFGRENKTAELKQYQYKDQQLAYALQEDRLHRVVEGLLKVISKQLDVLITLISTSRTEMSLAIRNHGGSI